jgi:CRP-like cAMP-binding protein
MVARLLCDAMVRDLTSAHSRTLLLGRMTAPERVAAFLLEMFERRQGTKSLDLPMSRIDIADYLGLTVETVCRTLSTFKRNDMIAVPNPHRIELLDRAVLEEIGEAQ